MTIRIDTYKLGNEVYYKFTNTKNTHQIWDITINELKALNEKLTLILAEHTNAKTKQHNKPFTDS